MEYDLYTYDKELAESVVDLIGRAYVVDGSERPVLYQFWDISEDNIRRLAGHIEEYGEMFEVRNSLSGGYIWPARNSNSLAEILNAQFN
ncbi:MAG: hypothetical protein AABX73_02360 [Nanoarchaeota archaeon]